MKAYSAEDFRAELEGPDPRAEELAYLQARLGSATALLAQSQPLAGVLFTERGSMEVADAMAAFGVEGVRYRFGTWVVTDDGVACLVHHFPLTHARLQEPEDWAAYLAEQSWVNLWDLVRALAVARHLSPRPRQGPQGDGAHPS
jgi:hypothetical protein